MVVQERITSWTHGSYLIPARSNTSYRSPRFQLLCSASTSNLIPVTLCCMRTIVINDSYLAFIFTQLSSYVDHTSARPFDVTSFSPSSPPCVVPAVWADPRLKGPTRANTIDFLKPARSAFHHGTAITRSQPSCRRGSTSSQHNHIGSRRVHWLSHTDYPHQRKRVGLPPSLKFC